MKTLPRASARPRPFGAVRPAAPAIGAALSLALYAAAMIATHTDTTFADRWRDLALWLLAVAALPATLLIARRACVGAVVAKLGRRGEFVPLIALLALALLLSFAWLTQYPFVAIYDQVRDGGLNAAEIADGRILNLFGFARYNSHGLIIPTIGAFFYRLFGPSTLTYRVPAALLAVADVALVYLLLRRSAGVLAGLCGALILLVAPLHLYYGRTEVVVIYSAVFTSAILLLLQALLRRRTATRYALLGLLLGVASNFHGSILTVALTAGALALALTLWWAWRGDSRRTLAIGAALLLVFYAVGLGPKALFVTPATFLHQGESFYAQDGAAPSGNVVASTVGSVWRHPGTLAQNYWTSLRVYVNAPMETTHYPDWQPLLDPVVAALFLLGLALAVFRPGDGTPRLLAFFALSIPLTNSAITNSINGDNRLLPALVVAAALAGYAAAWLAGTLWRGTLLVRPPARPYEATGEPPGTLALRRVGAVGIAALALYLALRGLNFFVAQPAAKGYTADDYLSMHAIGVMRSLPAYRDAPLVCIAVSPARFAYFSDANNRLLVAEQYEYFLPGHTFHVYSDPDVADDALGLSTNCSGETGHEVTTYTVCGKARSFTCPGNATLHLYVESEALAARPSEGIAFRGLYFELPARPVFIP